MDRRFDFLVAGSGIAGLFYALKVVERSPGARVGIVTKSSEDTTSTNRAQGGIAAVISGTDSVQAHVADTIRVGCGLCHKDVVEQVVEAGPGAIEALINYGVDFTRVDGHFDLGREGGHSHNRVVRAADLTGREIERALLTACRSLPNNIEIFPDHIVLDLVTYREGDAQICAGAYIYNEERGSFEVFYAPVTMLATGGLGRSISTRPIRKSPPATVSHAPTAPEWTSPIWSSSSSIRPRSIRPGRWPFLISEAVRGEGARLRSVDGRYFMEEAHELKDLAPRDVVARAIDKELKESRRRVCSARHQPPRPRFCQGTFPEHLSRMSAVRFRYHATRDSGGAVGALRLRRCDVQPRRDDRRCPACTSPAKSP